MKKLIFLVCVIIVCFGSTFLLKLLLVARDNPEVPENDQNKAVERVVSLAPSITETMFLLGIESKLVGVTIFCKYPAEAQNIDKVGGYSTPDFEMIAMRRPDLIIMLEEHRKVDLERKFSKLGLKTLVVSTGSVKKILNSIVFIGSRCGVPDKAHNIVIDLKARVQRIKDAKADPSPSVLITVGKNMGSAGLESVFGAGKGTYYHDLLQILGARNACPDAAQTYVQISGEGILRSSPDIIIDIVPEASPDDVKQVLKTWKGVPSLKAHIGVLTSEYCARPGPSFVNTLEDIMKEISLWRTSIQ